MSAPGSPGPAALLGPAPRARLEAGLRASRATYGDHGLTLEAFVERAAELAALQASRLGLPVDGARLEAFVERAALADLALACAAEAGSAVAWGVLHERFARRLEGFAVKHGLCSPDAEALVQDVFGDLASPPPRSCARTLLGTFDGSGSLFGWLSVVVLRRIAGAARRRRPSALDALEPAAREAARPARAPDAPAPEAAASAAEETARFAAAFAAAFSGLTAQQRLALVLKHRDGLSQREVGGVLGVGEARVSRVVAAALQHLVAALGPGPDAGPVEPAAWEALARSVRLHLASCALPCIPPVGRTGAPTDGPDVPPGEGA